MQIKQVILNNFKNCRDETVCSLHIKGDMCIELRDGDGYSDMFHAIEFVISDEYAHLSSDQRQALFYRGPGSKVIEAYVEITFDISDDEKIEKEEVLVRRFITAEQDVYFLNGEENCRSAVMNFLESTGISNSNPLYIVKQGMINQMANAPDADRLKLLLEVAGTWVYDVGRNASLAALREREGRVAETATRLETTEQHLSTLKQEEEGLEQYRQHNKICHALEYMIHEFELNKANEELQQMQEKKDEIEILRRNLIDSKKQVNSSYIKKAKLDPNFIDLTEEPITKANLDPAIVDLMDEPIKKKAKLGPTLIDLTEEVQGDNTSKERAESETALLTPSVKEKDMLKKVKSGLDFEKWNRFRRGAQVKIDYYNHELNYIIAPKENHLKQKIAELEEKIDELVAPADELHTQYEAYSVDALITELRKSKNELTKYSHVKKNVLDQFMSLSDEKEKLQKQKQLFYRLNKELEAMLSMFEQCKVQAIQFTFEQVSEFFTNTFKKLVPHGRAELVMKTIGNEEGREVEPAVTNSNNFTGIGVLASFTKSNAEMKEMNQLSDGQKSLVALSLVFACQKFNPAPFYLFDEIEGLDPDVGYKNALSEQAQYIIISTHNPEAL